MVLFPLRLRCPGSGRRRRRASAGPGPLDPPRAGSMMRCTMALPLRCRVTRGDRLPSAPPRFRSGPERRKERLMRWEPDRSAPALPYTPPESFWTAVARGARNRCPVCGVGKVFAGYLKIVPACSNCGAPLGRLRADDRAAVLHHLHRRPPARAAGAVDRAGLHAADVAAHGGVAAPVHGRLHPVATPDQGRHGRVDGEARLHRGGTRGGRDPAGGDATWRGTADTNGRRPPVHTGGAPRCDTAASRRAGASGG
jgi:hypothetical protein